MNAASTSYERGQADSAGADRWYGNPTRHLLAAGARGNVYSPLFATTIFTRLTPQPTLLRVPFRRAPEGRAQLPLRVTARSRTRSDRVRGSVATRCWRPAVCGLPGTSAGRQASRRIFLTLGTRINTVCHQTAAACFPRRRCGIVAVTGVGDHVSGCSELSQSSARSSFLQLRGTLNGPRARSDRHWLPRINTQSNCVEILQLP